MRTVRGRFVKLISPLQIADRHNKIRADCGKKSMEIGQPVYSVVGPENIVKTMGARVLLSCFRHKAYWDRERLRELSRFVEHSLRAEKKRRQERAAEELDSIADEYDAAFAAEYHAEDIFEVETDFPRLQRYALFVSMMGMVEANVVGLCRIARRILSITCEFKDGAPRVVARGVKYLEQHAGIDTSLFCDYIDLAADLNRVRNCVAHAEGIVKACKDAEKIESFLKRIPTADVDERGHLLLREGFVENMSHEMHTFLDRLHDAVSKRLETQQDKSSVRAKPRR